MISESTFYRLYNDGDVSPSLGIAIPITVYYLIVNTISILEKGLWEWWLLILIPIITIILFIVLLYLIDFIIGLGSFLSLIILEFLNKEASKKAYKYNNSPDYYWNKYLREIKWDSEKEALAELKAYKEGKISWQNIRMFSHPMVIGNFEFNGYNDPIFVYDEEYIDSDHPNKIGFLIISQGEFELLQRFKKEYLDLS
jgi:hypothetical protein